MQITRTPYEAVICATPQELSTISSVLPVTKVGETVVHDLLNVHVVEGRGFNCEWRGTDALTIQVGVGGLPAFAEAFEFKCQPVSGTHNHYDPPAFPEEENETSVHLVVSIA